MASIFFQLNWGFFQVVKDIVALDYARKLKFQVISEDEEETAQTPASIAIQDRDELIKGLLHYLGFVCFQELHTILPSVF